MSMSCLHLQVLQERLEQVVQPLDDDLMRLAPPPIPNEEMSFRTFGSPQAAQQTSFSCPRRTRDSN
jgi:hypothetical protein